LENKLSFIEIQNFVTQNGVAQAPIILSYQLFGPKIHTAPIVLANHALTGNSQVMGENGWWQALVGKQKTIDSDTYTILAFNVPGNGQDDFIIENYLDFTAKDIARLFLQGLEVLKINQLFAIIGGSVGGGIAWEMAALSPKITQNLIPIATDWKSTDWLMANCFLQEQILLHSSKPIEDARIHAMLCYRSPASFKAKFNRSVNENLGIFNVESWLAHHGKKLQSRFQLNAYKLMNQLLKTIDITRDNSESFEQIITKIEANIHIVGINSDLFFTVDENKETYELIKPLKSNIYFNEINSIHGHDAFLIEFEQLNNILKPIFNIQ
jgi:homoserine O-acetyltransferase/O-succinyltransferase